MATATATWGDTAEPAEITADPVGAFAAAVCSDLPAPSELPRIFIPVLGELRKARDTLNGLPKPYDLLNKFMDVINVALAPVRQFLELIEAVMAFKDCIMAIPDSLGPPPDPQPIIDCIKKLAMVIARLMQYIPPLPYIKSMIYLVSLIVDVIDALLQLLIELDTLITEWKQLRLIALRIGDPALIRLVECRSQEFGITAVNMADLLKIIVPLLEMMLDPISRLVPNPELKKMVKDLANARKSIDNVTALVQKGVGAIEVLLIALHPLVAVLCQMRQIVVTVFNILGPFFGLPPKIQLLAPSFSNF